MHMWTYFTSNKSNAYINWTTKNIQISKFKESNFDSKTYNVYNGQSQNGTTVTVRMALRKIAQITNVKLIKTV